MHVYLVEATIVDHPDYQTFVELFASKEKAVEFATTKVQEELDDNGDEGEIEVKDLNENQTRIMVKDGLSEYFVTKTEVK